MSGETSVDPKDNAPQIFWFMVVTLLMFFGFLRKTKGNPAFIPVFIASRRWQFLRDEATLGRFIGILSFIIYVLLSMPIIALFIFGGTLMYVNWQNGYEYYNGIASILVGICLICITSSLFNIKWKQYRIQKSSFLLLMFGGLCFIAYQLVVTFLGETIEYFSVAAIFLPANGIVMVVLIFFVMSKDTITITNIIDDLPEEGNREYDDDDTRNLAQIIQDEQADPSYKITKEMIFEIFTIATGERFNYSAVSGGLQAMFRRGVWAAHRRLVEVLLYFLALGILAVFAIIVYYATDDAYMGLLIAACVFSTDIILFFYIHAELSENAFEPTLVMLKFRFFLYVLGHDMWYSGYCAHYLILGLILIGDIINRKFPLSRKDVEKQEQRRLSHDIQDITKWPEFVLFIATCILILITVLVYALQPEDISFTAFTISDFDISLWVLCIVTILLLVVCMCFWICFRTFERKKAKIQDHVYLYCFYKRLDRYWVYLLITSCLIWILGVLVWVVTESLDVLIISIFFPFIWTFGLSGYAYWCQNDYTATMDIFAHNEKLSKLKAQEKGVLEEAQKYQDRFKEEMATGEQANVETMLRSQAVKRKTVLGGSRPASQGKETPMKLQEPDALESPRETSALIIDADDTGDYGHVLPTIEAFEEYVPEEDWREASNYVMAFFRGNLTRIDYLVHIFMVLTMIFDIALGITSYYVTNSLTYGTSVAVLLAIFALILLPLIEYFATGKPLGVFETLQLTLGVLFNFGYGLIYFLYELEQDTDDASRLFNILFLTFLFPIVFTYGSAFYKWQLDNWQMKQFSRTALLLAQIACLVFAVTVGLAVNWTYGGILLGVFVILTLYVGVMIRYAANGFYLNYFLKIFTLTLTLIVCAIGIVVGVMSNLGTFFGFSISYFSIMFFLALYTLQMFILDYNNRDIAPIFYSPWIFPIYKYDPKKETLLSHNTFGVMIVLICGMILVWSVLCVIWLRPIWIGIAVGALAEILLALFGIYLAGISPLQLSLAIENIANKEAAVKRAWLMAKMSYLSKKGVTRADDRASWQDRHKKRKQLLEMINAKRNDTEYTNTEYTKKENNIAWKDKEMELNNLRDMYMELYAEEKKETQQYLSKAKEVMILNNFLNSKRIELRSFGIDIQVGHGSIFDKFSEAQIQINKLSPTRRYRFKILKEQWKKDEMEKKRIQEERERAEQEANDERERKLKEILEKRNEMRAKLDEMDDMEGMDIQTMIDCPQKFKRIVRDCKANGSLFTDSQFPATAASCGDLSSKQVKEWRRPGPNCVLVEGEISPTDIKQGALGDCYFLSAMCVLGKARVEELFVDCFEDPKVGAYLIRFHKNDNPEYVIVDDFFPVGHNDNWAFCQTDSGTELWPMIIEKAYAKLHMGYDNIAAGKVQYALSDLTGGTPEEIRLAPQQDNPEPFWQKLMNFQASGYLMGAGSPEHPQGDSAVSEMGIVQGHAYAILDVRALDGEKLIQLKNPHGLHSVEWNGDWSDGDSKWTRKFKQELKQEEVDDGIFWMNLDDFIYEYKNLYICRIFNKTIWKALEPQNGEWKGDSAGGLPSKANPKATFSKNPQYIVTLKKPGNLFVRLTQNETIDMFKGQQPIIFMVVPTSSRIQDFSNTIGSSGSPTDLKTVSAEIDATGRSYPLKLNIMVASMNGGEKGEGTFGLHVHCTDMNSDIVPLK